MTSFFAAKQVKLCRKVIKTVKDNWEYVTYVTNNPDILVWQALEYLESINENEANEENTTHHNNQSKKYCMVEIRRKIA